MRHASLFSGIGGFDLAAEWMGWENVLHCEINPFCQRILKYYWPNATSYSDIKTTDFTVHNGAIDILTGGFPCQPYSTAGKRRGKEDDRHLWPEMLRAIREIQPAWVVGENVRGLTNWKGGMVFDEVQADLEALGYEVTPFILPACAVNAPHRRDRIWFVSYCSSYGQQRADKLEEEYHRRIQKGLEERHEPDALHDNRTTPHTKNDRRKRKPCRRTDWSQWRILSGKLIARCELGGTYAKNDGWQNFPTQPPVCGGDDGLPSQLDGITFSKWRNESIKGYGNAIVPQVAFEIFKVIEKMNNPIY